MIAAGAKSARPGSPAACYWKDIGTPQRYFEAAVDWMAPEAFRRAWRQEPGRPYPANRSGGRRIGPAVVPPGGRPCTLVLADHGIRTTEEGTAEVDATVAIGRHLKAKGAARTGNLPGRPLFRPGFLRRLGRHLTPVRSLRPSGIRRRCRRFTRRVVGSLVALSQDGAVGFDPAWAWQGPGL